MAAGGLVTLGLAFMWSGLLVVVVEYLTRMLIAHELDLLAVGVFTAAFRLSGILVNFVLGAMAADYYPSLTAVSHDHGKMRDLVNQQTEIGLFLAVPGLLATLALAPWIIQIFYTSEFTASADLLQWFVLGCLGRVISWPMGFIMLAKGSGWLFALTQTLAHTFHLMAIWMGLRWFGIEGVSMAFFVLYIFHGMWVKIIGRKLIDFEWSKEVKYLLWIFGAISVAAMIFTRVFPLLPATVVTCCMTFFVGIYCLRGLCIRLGDSHRIVKLVRKLPYGCRLLSWTLK